jgi:hypothetical protein
MTAALNVPAGIKQIEYDIFWDAKAFAAFLVRKSNKALCV